MGKLVKASEWAKRAFSEASRPDPKTIRKWILDGVVPGVCIVKTVYVYEEEFDEMINNQPGASSTSSESDIELAARKQLT